jgi:hypothetical protein
MRMNINKSRIQLVSAIVTLSIFILLNSIAPRRLFASEVVCFSANLSNSAALTGNSDLHVCGTIHYPNGSVWYIFCHPSGNLAGIGIVASQTLCEYSSKLTKNYQDKQGTNEAGYVHALSCLVEKRCQAEKQGTSKEDSFVDYVLRYISAGQPYGPGGLDANCPAWFPGWLCFIRASLYHGENELAPAFGGYCYQYIGSSLQDYEAFESSWTQDHEDFLDTTVDACLQDVVDAGEVKPISDLDDFIHLARGLRQVAQFGCRAHHGYPLFSSSSKMWAYNGYPTPFTKDNLYIPGIDAFTKIRVSAPRDFFLRPGETVQLHVTRINKDGSESDITGKASGTQYYIEPSESVGRFVTVSDDGLLSISSDPIGIVNVPSLLGVVVRNGTDVGLGQFAIKDNDSDGDMVGDSYESEHKRDPLRANGLNMDSDNDGLLDIEEAFLRTDPTKADTDADASSDACEVEIGSNPLDPTSYVETSECASSSRTQSSCFSDTGHCISGQFQRFWENNGGLAVFGFPITNPMEEINSETGKMYMTQWFERNRMELHPENSEPNNVLLGRLGADELQRRHPGQSYPRQSGPISGCVWFEATGLNVCDQAPGLGFKTYWQTHGLNLTNKDQYTKSLMLFGYPLTEARKERTAEGKEILVQWFERARLEWHPENADQFKVLLGLLGNEMNNSIHRSILSKMHDY